jgi:hypothetical protein
LLLAFFLAKANWDHPVLRFDSPMANHLVLALALFTPVAAFIVTWRATHGWRRAVALLALAPLLLIGSIAGAVIVLDTVFGAAELWAGQDGALEVWGIQEIGATRVVAYRTNCGATCAYGIQLRVERRIVPGLRLVRSEGSWYPADDATLVKRGTNEVFVSVEGRQLENGPPTKLRIRVRPWVYF